MRVLCVFGRYSYGDRDRGFSYESRNFIPAIQQLGHETQLFDSWDRGLFANFADMNRALVKAVEEFRPDVLLHVPLRYEVWTETLQLLRDTTGVSLLHWATDDSWKYSQSSRFYARHFDAVATTHVGAAARYHADGHHNVIPTQWGADAGSLQAPLAASQCRYPVSFIGAAHGDRQRTIRRLSQAGIDVECFGFGWKAGPVASSEIPVIVRQSQISLNLANSAMSWTRKGVRRSTQIKARTFEVPGAGGFLVTQYSPGLEAYYRSGREVVEFRSHEQMIDIVRWYLDHASERDRIAQAGYERTRFEHTYDSRLGPLLKATQERGGLRRSLGDVTSSVNKWERFDVFAQQHARPAAASPVLRPLQLGCTLLWGADRGPRAARKIAFELSWRLAGERTYSARGLPGRAFYAES